MTKSLTGENWWQRMRIAVSVKMIPDEWVVIEHLLFGRHLDHVTQVGFLVFHVVASRDVSVNTDVTVIFVRPAELEQQLRYKTYSKPHKHHIALIFDSLTSSVNCA